MRKIALLLQKSSSSWVSCKSITANLEKAYQIAFPQDEVRSFYLNESSSSLEKINLALELQSFQADIISFIDHKPHPGSFLSALNEFAPQLRPHLYFHVFGDFTLLAGSWLHTEELLRKYPVHFFCASEKQTQLLQGFLPQDSKHMASTLPFPVDTKDFYPEDTTSSAEDTIFLYTGRISLQKNILFLVQCFGKYLETINHRAQLWLAGPVDDIGFPYTGRVPPAGFQSSMLMRAIEMHLSPENREKVTYHGVLNGAELLKLYNQAQIYISMSTHNDEDFGMAPAEAAACGLPLVLSDWAGFSSFKNPLGAEYCDTVPVTLTAKAPLPDEKICLQKMLAGSLKHNQNNRKKIAQILHSYCSVEAVALKLRRHLTEQSGETFQAFHHHLAQLSEAQRLYPESPFLSGAGYSQLYRKIYDCYF